MNAEQELKDTALQLATLMEEKQAEDVMVLDISPQNPFFKYFILATGQSFVQLRGLADYVQQHAKKEGLALSSTWSKQAEDPWVLLDYGDIVVHIFLPETREYYNLEKVYYEAEIILNHKGQSPAYAKES